MSASAVGHAPAVAPTTAPAGHGGGKKSAATKAAPSQPAPTAKGSGHKVNKQV